ncbi:MAG: acetolactate synthase small subunit [Natrialbaceae archaeon]|nr:acetolactate synthase small subunit [Natrialbaceae archaeon]
MTGELQGPPPEERRHRVGRRNAQGIRVDPEVEVTHEPRKTVISALVKHEPGVLSNISGLFSRRQFNIESLTVGATVNPDRARMTIVAEEPEPGIEQVKKQLRKLVPVISVRELPSNGVRRELALIKVDSIRPDQVAAVTEMYGGKTVDATPETATVEITGSQDKIDAAIETFSQFGIQELSRTGVTALARGRSETADEPPIETTDPKTVNPEMEADDD